MVGRLDGLAGELMSDAADQTERTLEARRLIVEAGAAGARPPARSPRAGARPPARSPWFLALFVGGLIGAAGVGVAAAVLWHR